MVKQVAKIYIDCHVRDLASRPGVLHIHNIQREETVQQSLHAHIVKRVDSLYPEAIYGNGDGGILPEIRAMVQEQQSRGSDGHAETGFEMKQSTMPDQSMQIDQTFANVRPALVVSEGETDGGLSDEVIAQYTFGALSDLKVQMSNTFEDQFVSKYLPRSLKYDSGGPEYPKLSVIGLH